MHEECVKSAMEGPPLEGARNASALEAASEASHKQGCLNRAGVRQLRHVHFRVVPACWLAVS